MCGNLAARENESIARISVLDFCENCARCLESEVGKKKKSSYFHWVDACNLARLFVCVCVCSSCIGMFGCVSKLALANGRERAS